MIKDIIHLFVIVYVRIRVSKFDVNYGISLDFPEAPNENVNSCLQSAPPLAYLLLLYAKDLMDEVLAMY